MLRLGDLNENRVLTITAGGHISKPDIEGVTEPLEALLDQHDCVRFYVELEDVSGFGAGALWEDLKFDLRHRQQYGRTAIVGDRKWQDYASRLAGPLFGAEVRFFPPQQREAAWTWVNE